MVNEMIKAEIRSATKEYPKYVVMVKEFKFDSIRQDSYWVTKETREYRLRADAEAFAARFNTPVADHGFVEAESYESVRYNSRGE